jgi:hypothetical protein
VLKKSSHLRDVSYSKDQDDLEFELSMRAWAAKMLEDFPHTPNWYYYEFIMRDAERRVFEIQDRQRNPANGIRQQ